jgi:CRP/FNR family cyclic AMP-dependent transcriptional regulator
MHSPVAAFLSRLLKRRWIRTVEGLLHAVSGGDNRIAGSREGLLSPDPARREAAIVDLGTHLSPGTAARLLDGFKRASHEPAAPLDAPAHLRAQLSSPDPYVRATAIYILQSRGEASAADRQMLADDEHPLVRETLTQSPIVADASAGVQPSTLEKMIALCSVSLFGALEPEDLIRLAQASTEIWFMKDEVLCREGDVGDEAFVVLAGEVSAFRRDGDAQRLVSVEGVGTCIGELSVLDPAPRASTVVVSSVAVRALRLGGQSLRDAMNASPSVSEGIIRLLVRRLRGVAASAFSTSAQQPGEH